MKTVGGILSLGSSLHKKESLVEFYIVCACSLVLEGAFDNNGSCELICSFIIVRPCLVASLF